VIKHFLVGLYAKVLTSHGVPQEFEDIIKKLGESQVKQFVESGPEQVKHVLWQALQVRSLSSGYSVEAHDATQFELFK
jgi:hypothetical protein